jgi:hypothetical protein
MEADDEMLMAAVAVGDGSALRGALWDAGSSRSFGCSRVRPAAVTSTTSTRRRGSASSAGPAASTAGRPFRPWLFPDRDQLLPRLGAAAAGVDPLEHSGRAARASRSDLGMRECRRDPRRRAPARDASAVRSVEVVILRYYHDLPEGEVAEILGCPRGHGEEPFASRDRAPRRRRPRGRAGAGRARSARMISCDDVDELRALGRPLVADAEAHVRSCSRCREAEDRTRSRVCHAGGIRGAERPRRPDRADIDRRRPAPRANAARATRRRLVRALAAGLAPLPAILALGPLAHPCRLRSADALPARRA